DGRFAVDPVAAAAPPLLLAYAPGQTDAQGLLPVAAVRVGAGEREAVLAVDPRAAQALALRGAVVDARGAPISAAPVQWVSDSLLWPRAGTCGSEGAFALAGLVAGRGTLVVEEPRHGKLLREVTLAAGAGAVDLPPVVLQPPASLAVRLRSADTAPAAGVASL